MKALLTVFLASTVVATANARSIRQDIEAAEIKESHIHPNSYLNGEKLDGTGLVYINHTQKTATLQLNRRFFCPPGRFCPQVMPEPVMITLPIKKVSEGACNSVIYVAVKDKRPADGNYEGLRITDNRRFYETCRSVRAVEPTYVEYKTISAGFGGPVVETLSTFTAKPLQRN